MLDYRDDGVLDIMSHVLSFLISEAIERDHFPRKLTQPQALRLAYE